MGRIEVFSRPLGYIDGARTVRVYLPEGYDAGTERYPVVYMHDGQNVFEASLSISGCSWEVREALDAMERNGETKGVIVVGVDNDNRRRFDDYSPWKCEVKGVDHIPETSGGDGAAYAKFIVESLKPWVDQTFRTLPDRKHTAICGSSMGGVISAYMAAAYPDVFGCAGVFAIASWYARDAFVRELCGHAVADGQRFFVQVGASECIPPVMSQEILDCAIEYLFLLLSNGAAAENVRFRVTADGVHSETVWRLYMKEFFTFFQAGENR